MKTLTELRREKFISMRELSLQSGIDYRTIKRAEVGESQPNLKTIRRFAEFFGVKPGDIAFGLKVPGPVAVIDDKHFQLDLEKRVAWLEVAVRDCTNNIRELTRHTIALEHKLGMGVRMTIDRRGSSANDVLEFNVPPPENKK